MKNEKYLDENGRKHTKVVRTLWRKIDKYFTIHEIRTVCFDIGVDWDELMGDEKLDKLISLVVHLYTRGQLEELLVSLRKERPDADWPMTPPVPKVTTSNDHPLEGLFLFAESIVDDLEELMQPKDVSVPDATLQEILYLYYPEIWADIVQRGLYKKTLSLSDLLRKIRDYFNESEFRDLCFTLEVSYGQLGGEHYYDKARELISYCKRNGKLNDLIKLCREQRPHIIWDYE